MRYILSGGNQARVGGGLAGVWGKTLQGEETPRAKPNKLRKSFFTLFPKEIHREKPGSGREP